MFIAAVFFVPFYSSDEDYARVLRKALDDIGLSLSVPSLRAFFSLDLAFRGISWPSSLSFRPQLILGVSVGVLVTEYAQAAWRVVYYKLLHEEWGKIAKVPESIKKAVSLAIEFTVLLAAPVYARARDGSGVTDDDMTAWARDNKDATGIDLRGLTSLTLEGIIQLVVLLPHLFETFDVPDICKKIGCARRSLLERGGARSERGGRAGTITSATRARRRSRPR